jgi:pilus assembly protein FimV
MIRKLSLAVAVAAALSPLGAFALGLGEIRPYSELNQNFKAEIDLLSVDQNEIQDIRANLASKEAFERAGVERLFLLTGLKFEALFSASGKPIIAITSSDPIREPFLNFLLEVNWPKGRLVREFTVLLDPPVTLKRAPEQVRAPRVTRAPVTRATTAPAIAQAPQRIPEPVSTGAAGDREYGPVQRNDNLWTIAKILRNPDESIEQVMMALQRYNPDAFINNNVNNLKTGRVLRLPQDADVTSLSRQAAREEFLAQTRAWRSGTGMVAAPSTQAAPTVERDRLKLISAKAEGEAVSREGDAEVSRLEQEIMLVRESNESARQENEALRDRVQELEMQIKDIQRLVTLKSDELAQMQEAQRLAREKLEEVPPPVTTEAPVEAGVPAEAEAPAVVEPAVTAETTVPAEEMPTEAPAPEGMVIEEAATEEEVIEEAVQAEATPAEVEAPPVEAAATTEVEAPPVEATAEPAPVEPPVTARPEKKVTYFDSLMGNTTLLGIVGAVAVLLISMLWMIMRRRKETEAEFAESILVSPDSEIATAGKDEGDSLVAPTDETSFMSDFSPSDIDALQDETGEVDPLSEADVYIAYGRYQQAEELIKQAIEKFPERDELKQKLLEIYFSSKKANEFTKLAEELRSGGLERSNPDAWAQVTSMGRELNPTHALFAAAAGVAGVTAAGDEKFEDIDLSGEFPEVSGTSEISKPADEGFSQLSSDIDSMDLTGFENLDEIDSESLSADMSLDSEFLDKMESGEVPPGKDSMDIELSELDMASVEAPTEPESLDIELGGLDMASSEASAEPESLDIDLGGLDMASSEASAEPESLDIDLGELDLASSEASAEPESLDIELGGLDLASSEASAESESLDIELGGLDLASKEAHSEPASLDIDLGGLDLASGEAEGAAEPTSEQAIELDGSGSLDSMDLESIERELEGLSSSFETDEGDMLGLPEDESSEEVSFDLDSTDEVTTKLDLARAYIDMGDKEGAKSILEEVVGEGNDQQKQEARELLTSLV